MRRSTMTVRGHLLVLEAGGQQRAQLIPGEVYSEAGLAGSGVCLGEVAPLCR